MKTILALAMLVGTVAAQDRMADTLRKAVVEQDSQHNLEQAARDYQAVVAEFDEGRKTASTALFRLGEIYRQQGKKEQAIAAYQRVVHEFSDQSKLVGQSRAMLATYDVYDLGTMTLVQPTPEDVALAAANRDARARYRASLEKSLQFAKANEMQVADDIRVGKLRRDAFNPVHEQILKLERQLAAFDLGVIPGENK
jgi:tetratricopeptide (TPR) repeat protein